MTSQLASQLQRLQQRPGSNKSLSVSFLFDKNDARSFTREQIHQLASTGLQTLVVLDNRFHAFIEPLFSPQKTRLERDRLTAQENKAIDQLLDHFLTLLSPHLFLTAAQQVFEYLVRVYEVHTFNVMAVLRAFLPYHDHNLFARALLMLDLRDTGFQFLTTNQERGAPLLREHLILAAAESRKALRLVCLTMAFSVRHKVQNNAANALFAAVAVGLATHAEAESMWRVLVPFVLEFMSGDVTGSELGSAEAMLNLDDEDQETRHGEGVSSHKPMSRSRRAGEPENREAVCTALVVLASWCCEVQFTAPMMSALMKPLLRFLEAGTSSHPVVPLADLLQLLDLLFTTQQAVVQDLPFTTHLASLLEMPWGQWLPSLNAFFAPLASSSSSSQYTNRGDVPLRSLMTVLLQYALGRLAACQSLAVVPRPVVDFLQQAAEALPLSHALVKSYLKQLMLYEAKHPQEDAAPAAASQFLDRVALALESRYQHAFDETLSAMLQTAPETSAPTASKVDEEAPTSVATAEAQETARKESAAAAVQFLSRHLGGERYQMLTVTTRTNTTEKLPLFACLLHPLPAVRQVALDAIRGVPLSGLCSSARAGAGQPTTSPHNEEESDDGEGEGFPRSHAVARYRRDAKGSLLELLAHAAAFEADEQTAVRVMQVCAGVLEQLCAGLTTAAPAASKSKRGKAPNSEAVPDVAFCAGACCLLIRALHQLSVAHGGVVGVTFLEKVLSPFLLTVQMPTGVAETATLPSAAHVRSCAAYHAVQLYVLCASNALTEAKGLSEKAAALLRSAYPTLKPVPASSSSCSGLFAVDTPVSRLPTESRAGTSAAGKRGKAAAASSDSSDDDEDTDKKRVKEAKGASDVTTSSSTSSAVVLGVWACPAVLLDAWPETSYQLPHLHQRIEELALSSAGQPHSEAAAAEHAAQTEAAEVGLCVAVASQLAAEPSTGARDLQRFLLGHATSSPSSASADAEDSSMPSLHSRGYFGLCVSVQRVAARQALTGESRVAVGRGVQNSVLAADYTPCNRLTTRLAAVSQTAASQWLTKSSAPTGTVRVLLEVLGLLGAALPPLALNPDVAGPAMLELLSQHGALSSAEYPVEWVALVYDALVRPTTLKAPSRASQSALALVLFFPLWAPSAHRTALLQELQGMLLQGKNSPASAAMLLQAAMHDKSLALSLTTVSSIIESMAREESRFSITSAAADFLSQLLAAPAEIVKTPEEREASAVATGETTRYVIPWRMAADMITYFFAPLDMESTKRPKSSSSASQPTKTARLNVSCVLPRLMSLLTPLSTEDADVPRKRLTGGKARRRERGAAGTATVPMAAVHFLEVACRRVELALPSAGLSSSSASSSLAQDPVVALCDALLRTLYLTVRGELGGSERSCPVYRLALGLLAPAMQGGMLADEAAANGHARRNPLIFSTKTTAASPSSDAPTSKKAAAGVETYLEQVASHVGPAVLRAVNVVGSDVARLCVGTIGGFRRIFLPFLSSLTKIAATHKKGADEAAAALAGGEAPLEVLLELVRALAPASSSAVRHLNEASALAETEPTIDGDDSKATTSAAGPSRLDALSWQPPTNCVLSHPLTFGHAMDVLNLISATTTSGTSGPQWHRSEAHLRCLDLISALLHASSAIVFDDDDDDDEASLFALVHTVLDRFPISGMCDLLVPESDKDAAVSAVTGETLTTLPGSHRLVSPYVQRVLQLVNDLTHLCEHQSSALSEHNPHNTFKIRSALVKDSLLVMATLLLTTPGESAEDTAKASQKKAKKSKEVVTAEQEATEDLSRARIDVITELLRALAPLFSLRSVPARGSSADAAAANSSASSRGLNDYLHIPLAALLIRLEPVEKTEALRYRSAVEVCQEVLGSLDIQTQIVCIAQLMRLVMDPAGQLAPAEVGGEDEEADPGDDRAQAERRALEDTLHLFRRMVKPNQVINRQEAILSLVNLSVKAESFLGPFIELQHHSTRAGAKGRKNGHDGNDDDDDEANTRKAEEGNNTSEECMQLLVSSLELFAHYSDLNTQTPNDTSADGSGPSHVADGEYSEEKGYVMLLELLAGNALACVLAGINEPTFVSCLQRLLVDSRTALQLKGLEVLLDRLHHSLPTVENTLTDEELEQHRRELRDPRKRLTLVDLIRIKARPLTTKRSFSLYPLAETILRAAIRSLRAITRSGVATTVTAEASASTGAPQGESIIQLALPLTALDAVFRLAQLASACMEELIRIVGSGGSTQAEKTLLNASRSKRVTEAMLSKLFGNKARVQQVHDTVEAVCSEWVPQLTLCLHRVHRAAPSSSSASLQAASASKVHTAATGRAQKAPSFNAAPAAAAGEEEEADEALVLSRGGAYAVPMSAYTQMVEEGFLGALTMLVTMLASTVQVMGLAFTAPHCLSVLETIVSAAVFQVVELPWLVSQSASGSLLRRTTLSALVRCYPACWQFSQPLLPRMLFAATHLTNVNDAETNYLSTELLTVLEALLEPQLFIDACAACLRGTPYVNVAIVVGAKAQQAALAALATRPPSGGRRGTQQLRLLVATHSFHTFFQCIQRRVQNLRKEELAHMPMLVDGTTASDNLWLSALEALAVSATMPPTEVVTPVMEAFTTFFLKFKPKHCVKFLRRVSEWAFAASTVEEKAVSKRGRRGGDAASDSEDERDDKEGAAARQLSRTTLHRWLTFYALANHLLDKLGAILDFGFPVLVPYVTSTLHTYCSAGTHPAKQHAPLLALTLEGALELVRRMALAQTPGPDYDYSIPLDIFFATPEVFNGLMPALVHQLTNLALLQDENRSYNFRAEHAVTPAVRAFFACLNATKLQSKTQAELARGLRHPSRLVRRQTVLCLDGIYADGGEELASRLMAEVLPAVVELTEDRDDDVVEAARTMCTNLSQITGQDVLHAMS